MVTVPSLLVVLYELQLVQANPLLSAQMAELLLDYVWFMIPNQTASLYFALHLLLPSHSPHLRLTIYGQ